MKSLGVWPSKKLRRHLAEHGVKGRARVLKIARWGNADLSGQGADAVGTSGADPIKSRLRRKMKIRIEPGEGPAVEVEAKLMYRLGAHPEVGTEIPVIYDPADPGKILIDEDEELRRLVDGEHGADMAAAASLATAHHPEGIEDAVSAATAAQGADPDALATAREAVRTAEQMGLGSDAARQWLAQTEPAEEPGADRPEDDAAET